MRSEPDGQVRLAAGEQGGLYLTFAEILANQIQARYPDLGVDAVSTEGSVDNLARLRSGDVGMGLALADVAERDRAAGPADTAPLAVARVYENYLQVVVRDSAAVLQLTDLEGCGSPLARVDRALRRPARCCSTRPALAVEWTW